MLGLIFLDRHHFVRVFLLQNSALLSYERCQAFTHLQMRFPYHVDQSLESLPSGQHQLAVLRKGSLYERLDELKVLVTHIHEEHDMITLVVHQVQIRILETLVEDDRQSFEVGEVLPVLVLDVLDGIIKLAK